MRHKPVALITGANSCAGLGAIALATLRSALQKTRPDRVRPVRSLPRDLRYSAAFVPAAFRLRPKWWEVAT